MQRCGLCAVLVPSGVRRGGDPGGGGVRLMRFGALCRVDDGPITCAVFARFPL
jgi:hypothetical protein